MRISLFILIGLIVASYLGVQAQEFSHAKKFNIGAQGGVQFTNLDAFNFPYSPQSKTGFYAGIFGEYNITRSFKVRLGLQFDQRNFEMYGYTPFADSTGSAGKSFYLYQTDYNVNYLTIPLNINFSRGNETFKIYIQAGVYYSVFMNATHKGVEGYYIDANDNLDLSESILHVGTNEFVLDGATRGVEFVNISTEESEFGNETYRMHQFNAYDFGLNLFVGLIYQVTPDMAFSLAPGFSYSLTNAFAEQEDNYKWLQITRVNLGFIYTLNLYRLGFGQKQSGKK